MEKAKVYTRTGDTGQTSLVGGRRVSKGSLRLETYGTVDELNSFLGLLLTYLTDETDVQFVENLQHTLFRVGTLLATPPREGCVPESLDPACVETIEREIDRIEALLPPLRCFILPNGCRAAAVAHVCRTVLRRAERAVCRLAEQEPVDAVLITALNRMSDYLFVLARKQNFESNLIEKTLK